MDKNGLLYTPPDAVFLPVHNGGVVHINMVSCGKAIVKVQNGFFDVEYVVPV